MTIFITLSILVIFPGVLLLLGTIKFKSIHWTKNMFIAGSILIAINLISEAGTYYFSFVVQDSESLAEYSLINAWISSTSRFIGTILIAIGFLFHSRKVRDL